MEFDRVRNEEQRQIRIEQIKNAAIKLFDTEQFHEITLAKIANETNFTRGNLYKYISSKEDIYLLVALDEIHDWINDLRNVLNTEMTDRIQDFSHKWATIMYRHQRFLKLISLLFTIIEKNVALDNLVDFKKNFAIASCELNQAVGTAFPAWDDTTLEKFTHLQMHYAIGLFPSTSPAPIQQEAAKQAGRSYRSPDFVADFSEFLAYTVEYLNHRPKAKQ